MSKKIAIIARSCPPNVHGGVSTAHYNLFLFLKKQGFNITFFTYNDIKTNFCSDDACVVRYSVPKFITYIIRILSKIIWKFCDKTGPCTQLTQNLCVAFGALAVRRRLHQYKPDIIILPDRHAVGFWIGRPGKCKIVHISHHNPDRFRSALLLGAVPSMKDIDAALWMERKGMRFVDRVICPSMYMEECFVRTFGAGKRIDVIPNLVDISSLDIPRRPPPAAAAGPAGKTGGVYAGQS